MAMALDPEVVRLRQMIAARDWKAQRTSGHEKHEAIAEAKALRALLADWERRGEALRGLRRQFTAGTRVTNCVAHMGMSILERPDGCALCLSDLRNHMSFAIRVNEFLNGLRDEALARAELEGGKP